MTSRAYATLDRNCVRHARDRAGTSLYADMTLDTMLFYNADTSGIRIAIENIVK